jgi:hypothetical protein
MFQLYPVALAVFLVAITGWLLASSSIREAQLRTDAKQYAVAASNIAKFGTFSDVVGDNLTASPRPSHRREPAYPFLIAKTYGADLRSVSTNCLVSGEACSDLRLKITSINSAILAFLVVAIALAAFWFTRNQILSLLAALLVMAVDWFGGTRVLSEGLAALLLLVHASGLAISASSSCTRWQRAAAAGIGGIALAMLIMTKAIFLYWAILLAIGWLCVALRMRQRTVALLAALSLLPAIAVCTGWAARNYMYSGSSAIAGRDGEILTLRTAYLLMSWDEYKAGFIAFAPRDPSWLQPLLKSALGAEHLGRYGWKEPNTFFRTGMRAKAMGEERSRFDGQVDRDRQLRASATRAILAQPLKYGAQSILFAWRAAFPQLKPFSPRGQWSTVLRPLASFGYGVAIYARLLLGMGLFFAAAIFGMRKRIDGLLFIAPAFYCWGIHAAVTDGYPRYMQPAVPIMVVALTFVIVQIFIWLQSNPTICRLVGKMTRRAGAVSPSLTHVARQGRGDSVSNLCEIVSR